MSGVALWFFLMPPLPHSLRSKCILQELQKDLAHQRAVSASLKFNDYCLREECVSLSSMRACATLLLWNLLLPVLAAVGLKPATPRTPPHTQSQPALSCLVLSCIPKLYCSAPSSLTILSGCGKTTLKGSEQPKTEFFDPYHSPSTGPGTLLPR